MIWSVTSSPPQRRKSRKLRQLVEREHALVTLAGDHPGRIRLYADALAEVGPRFEPFRVALDVWEELRRRPEPGLLLFARRSPEGAVHDGATRCEMTGERFLIAGRRRGGIW